MSNHPNLVEKILGEINRIIIGKEKVVEKVLTSILAKGHVLIEDVPGVGKTTLALCFSKVMELEHNRLQFTPDVLPTDVVGYYTINRETEEKEYRKGPVICNLFLADEINRTSSKTQSSLLEVMEEGNVTVDGITMEVPKPFTVIATQNPIGSIGTQSLPESQLDRFMIRITIGYPSLKQEIHMLKDRQQVNPMDLLQAVVSKRDIRDMQVAVEEVYIHDSIYEYIAKLVDASRKHPSIELGVSPRGTIALCNMVKATAFVNNRDFVIPDDVIAVIDDVFCHRILLNAKARVNKVTAYDVINDMKKQITMPKIV